MSYSTVIVHKGRTMVRTEINKATTTIATNKVIIDSRLPCIRFDEVELAAPVKKK